MHPSALINCSAFFDAYTQSISQISSNPRVLEIGSQNINGSIRECCPPSFDYIGVDFVEGVGVDLVLSDPYILPFPDESFDVVVTSSCLEHSEMFWLIYIEMLRVISPSGLLYVNAPSNGELHQWPVDCWRFYPDCGLALVSWAKRNDLAPALLESYTSYQIGDQWNDFVAIFIKNEANVSAHPARILNSGIHFMNGRMYGCSDLLNKTTHPEDYQFSRVTKRFLKYLLRLKV
jgi:SAM-dependent methyltransferase